MPSRRESAERSRLVSSIDEVVTLMESSTMPSAVRSLLDTDLTFHQLKVLTVLVTTPEGSTVRGLAETFGVSMASMSTMIDRLVSQTAARRDVDPEDSRVRRVHATATGRDVVRKLVNARPEYASDILDHLPLEDLRALAQGMRAVSVVLAARAVPNARSGGEQAAASGRSAPGRGLDMPGRDQHATD